MDLLREEEGSRGLRAPELSTERQLGLHLPGGRGDRLGLDRVHLGIPRRTHPTTLGAWETPVREGLGFGALGGKEEQPSRGTVLSGHPQAHAKPEAPTSPEPPSDHLLSVCGNRRGGDRKRSSKAPAGRPETPGPCAFRVGVAGPPGKLVGGIGPSTAHRAELSASALCLSIRQESPRRGHGAPAPAQALPAAPAPGPPRSSQQPDGSPPFQIQGQPFPKLDKWDRPVMTGRGTSVLGAVG